jgi:hypothetical protein
VGEESEARDPLRDRRPSGRNNEEADGDGGLCSGFEVIVGDFCRTSVKALALRYVNIYVQVGCETAYSQCLPYGLSVY